jgi:prophage DNA circulation protein
LQVTEFPLRDEPDIERLGKKTVERNFDCFVIGADYMDARDALLAELDKQQTQVLVHPWLGTLRVEISNYTFSETAEEGGMARFQISYFLAASKSRPEVIADTRAGVAGKATVAKKSIADQFEQAFSIDNAARFVNADAIATAQRAMGAVQTAVHLVDGPATAAGKVLRSVDSALSQVSTLVSSPSSLAGTLTGLVSRMGSTASNASDVLRQCRSLFAFGDDDADIRYATTPMRKRQRTNRSAINTLVQQSAVITAAEAVPAMTFTSRNDAQAVQDEIANQLDRLMDSAPDDVYVALLDLRAAVLTDISARALNLAALKAYSPRVVMPSLVIAYDVYGDARRAGEIVARNNIRHPAFVSTYPPLEVLAK